MSVIVPTWNRLRYLREAIESVRAQSYEHWELVVVDDGSTDGSRDYLAQLADPRVKPLVIAHTGSSAKARNAGIRLARGKYLAFLDDDDVWMPRKLERQLTALRDQSAAQWNYTNYIVIDVDGHQIPRPAGRPWMPYSGWILQRLLQLRADVSTPTVIARRQLICDVGAFDEDPAVRLREDYDLWFRIAARAQVVVITDALCAVREHDARSTRSLVEPEETWVRVYQKARAAAASRRIRIVCDEQCAHQLTDLATRRARMGDYGGSLEALVRSLRYRWPSRAWLLASGKLLIRRLGLAPSIGRIVGQLTRRGLG